MESSFEVYLPVNEFDKTLVHNIWRMSSSKRSFDTHAILPNGSADIIFNFSDSIMYNYGKGGCAQVLPRVFICGARFKPINQIATGTQNLIGIQVHNFALKVLFGLSAKDFTEKILDGQLINKELHSLADSLFSQDSFHEQTSTIMQWVRNKMIRTNNFLKLKAMQEIVSGKWCVDLTVKEISYKLNLSQRQLLRFSDDWIGMKTEKFIQYNKYLKSIQLIQDPRLSLIDIALQCGYFDQSHFIRDFKFYTEMTPGEYKKLMFECPEKVCIELG
jgi:AraC-like DNA-binding protein